MTKLISLLTAASLAVLGGQAAASTVSATHTLTQSGTVGSVSTLRFQVTQAGLFDIYTDGPTIDPVLYLIADSDGNGTIDATDLLVASDDDRCRVGFRSFCNQAGAWHNSLIEGKNLTVGNYFAVVSDYSFSESEARSGVNGRLGQTQLVGDVTTYVTSARYGARGGSAMLVSAVPLPASGWMMLAAFTLLGAGAASRRTTRAA
jgi:hypothetical protein